MKRSTKAMLLSALVFPGTGHFYLKRPITGLLLAGTAAVALYVIASVAWDTALDIVGKIESGTVAADPLVIQELVSLQLQTHQQTTSMATIVLTACWLLGIAGSYWATRKDNSNAQL
jgi:TM2 domain-containing membrane protein YozV